MAEGESHSSAKPGTGSATEFDRVILVYVVDERHDPIAGAKVTWTLTRGGDETTLGPVTTQGFSDRPAKIQFRGRLEEPIRVTARFGRKKEEATLPPSANSHTFVLSGVRTDAREAGFRGKLAPLVRLLDLGVAAVPRVKFAWGVVALAAAGAIVAQVLGKTRVTIITIVGVFVGMLLLFIFSQIERAGDPIVRLCGHFLLLTTTAAFVAAIVASATAVAICKPPALASFYRLEESCPELQRRGATASPVASPVQTSAMPGGGTTILARRTVASEGEVTCLNEWVLVIAAAESEEKAKASREKFLERYRRFGHTNRSGTPIWENNVWVTRDPSTPEKWLVVIDQYEGASSEECQIAGRNEMIHVLDSKPDTGDANGKRAWEDSIGHFLRDARPLCYDLATFEKTYGRVDDDPGVSFQRGLGSCSDKHKRADPSSACDEQPGDGKASMGTDNGFKRAVASKDDNRMRPAKSDESGARARSFRADAATRKAVVGALLKSDFVVGRDCSLSLETETTGNLEVVKAACDCGNGSRHWLSLASDPPGLADEAIANETLAQLRRRLRDFPCVTIR